VDSNKDISRRAFVGLMGVGTVGQVLPQQQERPAGPSAAVKEAVQGIKEPQVAAVMTTLLQRVEQLEQQVRDLSTALSRAIQPSGQPAAHAAAPVSAAAPRAVAQASPSEPAYTLMRFGPALAYGVPLGSSVQWERREDVEDPQPGTTQVLSLVHENNKATAFPWTLSTLLRTKHTSGEAAANFVRLSNYGGGWGAGFHAEAYSRGGSPTLGTNIEMHRQSGTGRVIGVNVHAVDWDIDDQGAQTQPKPTLLSEALNVQCDPQASWETGLHFDNGSRGTRAIWVEGSWTVGLDMGSNNIRMDAGSKIFFEGSSMVYMMYNAAAARIEFRYGSRVLGYIPLSATEHAL